MRERRRHPRTTLNKPVPATVDAMPVFVLDVSTGGLRVVHQSQLPEQGSHCRFNLPSEKEPLDLDVVIVHTAMQHATAAAEQLFSTGLQIRSKDTRSKRRLKSLAAPRPKSR